VPACRRDKFSTNGQRYASTEPTRVLSKLFENREYPPFCKCQVGGLVPRAGWTFDRNAGHSNCCPEQFHGAGHRITPTKSVRRREST
jgi:hypothetical protein